ncbi:MAG: DJ-1/PfpI family protein [Deferribacteraceae bacterium]|jgi:4-methyl-5(b-hydroxyethyl)-thiazole monophosphate biosynthesis|nr:DJ-1/PfpI family protein [Deferribacteraceae bacterium]
MQALVLLADGFEEVEALTPIDLLRRAGVTITTASISDSQDVMGSHNVIVKADTLLKNVADKAYDMVILPGGGVGTQNLGKSELVTGLLKRQYSADKYVAAICAAPTILPKAGINGHKMTCYPAMADALDPQLYCNERVVVSGKVITSRSAGTAMDFALELIKTLLGEAKMQEIKAQIVY